MYENLVVWIAYDLIIGDKNLGYKNVPKLEKRWKIETDSVVKKVFTIKTIQASWNNHSP